MESAAQQEPKTREELELSLYVLRSDFNRAVNFADKLRSELIEVRRALAERPRDPADIEVLQRDAVALSTRLAEVEAKLAAAERAAEQARSEADELRVSNTALRAAVDQLRAQLAQQAVAREETPPQ